MFKMIRILIILFFGLFATQLQQALADSDKIEGYLEQDVLQNDRINIYSKDGRRDGYLKSDTLSNQKTNIFNKSGHRKGFIEKDT